MPPLTDPMQGDPRPGVIATEACPGLWTIWDPSGDPSIGSEAFSNEEVDAFECYSTFDVEAVSLKNIMEKWKLIDLFEEKEKENSKFFSQEPTIREPSERGRPFLRLRKSPSTGLGGFSTLDEAPGSRASYSTHTDSEGAADYALTFDNESIAGSTVVGIDGMDKFQDNLLMDLTLSFYEMGISVQSAQLDTKGHRVVHRFIVSDDKTRAAIPEDRWLHIKEKIFAALKRRNVLNTATGDPKLVELVTFLTQTLDKAVRGDGKEDVLGAAYFLQNGFEELRRKEDPRKRGDLLRYIENLEQPKITAVIRLFYLYSSLLTVADEAHSHRLRGEQVWGSKNRVAELFNRTEYNPVFTAHPTEARRREVLTCLRHIFLLCSDREVRTYPAIGVVREDPRLSPSQKAEVQLEIETVVEMLWGLTDEMRATKPNVLEEMVTGLDYHSLFEAVCTTYRYAENSMNVKRVERAERHVISSDFVQQFFTVKSGTEANAAATINEMKHPHAMAEKNGVEDWRSMVLCDGRKGAGDPLAADFVKQKHFKDLSQPGFANEGIVRTRTCAGTLQNLLNVDLPTFAEFAGTGDSLPADSMKQNNFKGLSQPGLAKTCAGMFHNLLNVELPMNARWMESISRKLQKNWTMQFGGRGVQENALVIFKMMLSMLLFDNFPAKVGAIAPEPAIEGTLQAANSDSNSSNFAFGLVAAIGVLFTIFQVLISMKWTRRPSLTSSVSTESLNRETRTVQRWCKTECTVEIMVAHRVEEGV